MTDLIEIGKIVNTHGIKGEVKVSPWVDSLDEFHDFKHYFYKKDGNLIELHMESLRFHKNCAMIKFREIADLTEAEKYRETVLLSEKNESLPTDTYYIKDLIGLDVISENKKIGTVKSVFKTGANDVYEVAGAENKVFYVPAVKDFIKEINLEKKYICINVIEGLID